MVTCLSHTTARNHVRLMEQTIEKYSFMLRMQSADLPNILFGKACRECWKHGPVQDPRHLLNRGVLITGTMTMAFGNSHRGTVRHHDGCEEAHPDTTVPPNINASVFNTLYRLMFHAKETPHCAKVCGDMSLSHTDNGHETPSLQCQPLPDATKLF